MAELVVSMAIGPLVSMLRDKASSYLLDEYNVMEGMEEQHKTLKRKLPAILDVITDAEEQATAHREGAKAWLQELKTVAYEANEVFDEFKYGALRREARKKGHYRELGFDAFKLFPTHNRIVFRYRMSRKLCRIRQALEVLIAEMHAFRFKYRPQPPVSRDWRKTDHVIIDPQKIAGRSRDTEKKEIVDILLGSAGLAVVPIVGMGGLGTERSIKVGKPEGPSSERWKRQWVFTTTPDKQVAEIMGADRAYNLNVLEDSFLKEIIEARAFSSKKEKPVELVEMVGEIVKRCSGSPLAAIALGSVLWTKTSVDEWKDISSRSSICTVEAGILPILKLSYNDLPSHMKQCFAFCAVFPKDHKIDVEKLIQLWIANGLIPEDKEDSAETIGKHIFRELASRSFFHDIESENSEDNYTRTTFRIHDLMHSEDNYTRTTCKIHDLMHDIAMSVMDKECVVAIEKPSQTEWLPDSARHLFLSCEETDGILNGSMEKRSPAIQTLLIDSPIESALQHQSKYNSLHALKVHIRTESFLLKPKYLHHMRYLDLSSSDIEALPEDISILYNLQMLDVSKCRYLG